MKNTLLLLLSLSGLAALGGGSSSFRPAESNHFTYHKPLPQDTLRRDTTKKRPPLGDRTGSGPSLDLTLPDLIPPAPAAMEIAKGIAYPVDLSSGLLNIEIPLYEIVSGDIHVPITLSYHASGLKPGIFSRSWLPQGWSLSVGPTLTRVIRGGPDEYVYDATLAGAASLTWDQLNDVANQVLDIALDEFYYSLPGHSGRLYLTRTPAGTGTAVTITPVTVPSDPVAVTLPGATGDVHRQVDMTDPIGTRYRFGSPDDNSYLDRTYARFGGASLDVATSWKIRTITSGTTGGWVSFEYFSTYTETTFYSYSDALTMVDDVTGQVSYASPAIRPGLGGTATAPQTYIYSDTAPGHITSVDPGSISFPAGYTFPMVTAQAEYQETTYPSRITFPGGTVTFVRASTSVPGCHRLSKITVEDSGGDTVREITFTQYADPDDGELRLDGVTVSSGDATPESWSFTYDGPAPPRMTRDVDRWGYYNGAGNATLVPTVTTAVSVNRYPFLSFTDTVTVPGGNREPSEDAMRTGMLSSVTYPTGGRAEFTYEAHRYLDTAADSVKLAGGLRIKSVRETAASGQSTWRHFTYGTSPFRKTGDATGTGLPAVVPHCGTAQADPLEMYYRETACHEFVPSGSISANYKERVWTDNSMVGLFSDHGSSVLYPYVMETVSPDGDGDDVNGAVLHSFNVTSSHPTKLPGTPLVTDSRDGWSKGEEVSTLTLKGSSSSSTMTDAASLSTGYSLETSQGAVKTGQVYKGHRVYGTDEMYVADQYKAISHVWSLPLLGRKLLTSRSETAIESNGSFTSSESFTYDSYNNVTLHTVTGSKRSGGTAPSRITKYWYPGDFNTTVCQAMEDANIVSVPVRTEEYVDGVSPGNLLTTRETGYKWTNVGSGSTSRTIYVPGTESLDVGASASDIPAPSSGTRTVTLGTYDRRGNVMERTGLDGRTEVILWGYEGTRPVARVRGSTLGSVLAALDTSRLNTGTRTQIAAQLTSLRSAFAGNNSVHVETWTWIPLVGMASAADPSGRTASWTYDAMGRLTGAYAHDGTAARLLEDYTYTINQTMPDPASSSGSGWNGVRTRTMLSSSGTSGAYLEKTAYVDGLARVAEEVTRTGSASFPSLVTLQEYDGFGRKASAYPPLALASDNGGAYVTPSTAKGRAFLTYLDVYADSYPEYEPTPRDRVTASHGPGSPWRTRGRYVGTEYLVNTAGNGGVHTCSFYEVASATSLKKDGVYAAGELGVVRTTDEDGASSLVFTDKWGREVLHRRVISSGQYADTYYVYDDLGLLRYVLTPEASASLTSSSTWNDSHATLRDQAYIYKYDSRGRRTSSKLPGSEAAYLRYDRADRVAFTQDGVQRRDSLWTFTLRDFLGRECVTGTAAVTLAATAAAAADVPTATFTTGSAGTALGGYTASGITLPAAKTLLSVSYYDSYSFLDLLPAAVKAKLSFTALTGYGTAWPSNGSPGAKGLPTGSRSYLAGDGASYSAGSVYYDWKARPVQNHSVDHEGTSADSFLALSFTGNVTASREVVTVPASLSATGAAVSTVTTKTMTYDAWDRLTGESVTAGDGTATGSVSDAMSYSYDAVGRMTGRTYGGVSSTGSTAETMSYDVRDHLTSQSSPVFSSTLRYTDPSRTATTGRYDGSISEWSWSRGTGSTVQTYAFAYDGLGRLTGTSRYVGSGTTATNAFTEQGLAYDRNGNVTALTRYGTSASATEDDFTFTLAGNRISSLTNSGTNGSGVTYTSYAYDEAGNMTHDGRTGQDLSWNLLNLISGVSKTENGTTTQLASYNWYADGTKYSAERPDGSGYVYKGNVIYERAANGTLTLDCVLTTGGRIVANKNSSGTITGYTVYHHITDHLGSVRAITDASTGTVVETSDFLPFGTRWSRTGGSLITTLTDSTNRWRYSGKEEQAAALDPDLPLIDYGARMYDPAIARWMSVDPMAEKNYPMSPYAYCYGNPLAIVDHDGKFGETLWDLLNVAMDAKSLVSNIKAGKTKAALLDAGGLVADVFAAAVPVLPGGAGTAIKAIREADKTVDAIKAADKVSDVAKAADGASDISKTVSQGAKRGLSNPQHITKAESSRSARRESMRKQGIPTSQQPISQSRNKSGREYRYELSGQYGETITKSVQQQTLDSSHPFEPHWEAGTVKENQGEIRYNSHGFPKLKNDKSKVYYD